MISGRHQQPKYSRILDSILEGIIKGEWDPGDRIPPERELAKQYDASVGTVRHALQHLVSQGYLNRAQGRGTFVNQSVEHYDTLRYFRFASDFVDVVQPLTIQCLEPPVLDRYPEEARIIGVAPEQKLYEVRRTFSLGKVPMVYVVTYLREDMFPGFGRLSTRTMEELALYVLAEAKYGLPTLTTQERFSAIAAGEEVAEILGLAPGAPVLKIMMLAYTMGHTPYGYQVAHCNTSQRQIFRDRSA